MLKAQELRLLQKLDQVDKNNEIIFKAYAGSFNGEIKELRMVSKERHVMFVKDVKTARKCEL